jgi:hypothetical protein
MVIYNVTVKVSHRIHAAWLQWMTATHLPAVMATGCFEKYQLVRLLDTDEDEGPTYAAQYYAPTLDDYHRYVADHAPALQQAGFHAWGHDAIAFRSLMQVVV